MNPWDRKSFARPDAGPSFTQVDIGILALAAIIVGIAVAWIYNDTRMRCEETLLTESISPDGAWKAAQYRDYCQGFLVTTIAVVVRLVSTRNPSKTTIILADSAYTEDERPRVAWTGQRTLQVNVQGSLFLNVLTCEFDGIRIDVRLPPDDSDKRAAFYRRWGKPDPDPGAASANRCSQQSDRPAAAD